MPSNVWTKAKADACMERYRRLCGERKLFSCDEFQAVLAAFDIPTDVSEEFYRIVDVDKSQTIEPDELGQFLTRLIGVDLGDKDSYRRILFNLLDKDSNGYLDAQELKHFCDALDWPVDIRQFDLYFKKHKVPGLSYDQFVAWRYQSK